jgi:periplasmic protein TonB
MKGASAPTPVRDAPHLPPPIRAKTAAAWSVGGHIALLAALFALTRLALPAPTPPAYNVELVAAPSGPRALGAVTQGPTVPDAAQPAAADPAPAPDPATPTQLSAKTPRKPDVRRPETKKPAAPARPVAPKSGGNTTVPGRTPAGGGPTGGRGTDVASVKVQGTAFPFPGYLQNITRQIAINFKPRPGMALRAEVSFLIHRDGSVSDLRMVSRSGTYAFDLECLGAVEAVGQRKSFGALPSGFRDDVLPVVFSFDPSVLR